MIEKTFAIIKPNAIRRQLMGKIIHVIEEGGFKILQARMDRLTPERAQGFYAEHKGKPFFNGLIEFMTSGLVFLMVLEKEDGVNDFRKLMGATDPAKAAPGTLRKLYGENIEMNSIHGSDSLTSSKREITYFFGETTP